MVTSVNTKVSNITSPYALTGLTNGIQYAFAVSAVNAGGESGLSAVQTATPTASAANTVTDADGNVYQTVTIGTSSLDGGEP